MRKVVIGLMVVVAVGGAFAFVEWNGVLVCRGVAKDKLTELKLKEIVRGIDQYRLRYNTLPTQLSELIRCPPVEDHCIPVIKKEMIVDAWEREIRYEVVGNTYRLTSLGGDDAFGGQPDIILVGP